MKTLLMAVLLGVGWNTLTAAHLADDDENLQELILEEEPEIQKICLGR